MTSALVDAPWEDKADWTAAWPGMRATETSKPTQTTSKPPLSETWRTDDPVEDALLTLAFLGRNEEAELIRTVLERREECETDVLIRTLVSNLWAEGWDSEEDAVYDDM